MEMGILKQELNDAIKRRGANREKGLNSFGKNAILHFKENGLLTFPRSYFYDFCGEIPQRTQRKVISEIIQHLLKSGMIKEYIVKKQIYAFRNKTLSTNDYNSYNLMMSKNGYRRNLYKRNGFNKKKVCSLNMGDLLPDTEVINPLQDDLMPIWNESEIKSYKSLDRQGVYNNGSFSIVRDKAFISEKKVYSIQ